ncbi:hypothetical protein SGZLLDDJ_CDS_0013 [Mycoplasmopsis phage vB_Mfe_PMF329]|nr:hypothetical protein SGZLLDDJ_CDS_0013 [Mycoplasmopsis phage vB_Mfe_PMF329]
MDLKKFYGNITLEINGHENWAFDKVIKFNYHATNFSKVILNNVINKSIISDGLHFRDHPYLNITETFSIATLKSNGVPFFTGIINSSGRYSLNPNKVKDKSLEIVDVRLWLSKKSPTDVVFENITPYRALERFIRFLNEPKIKIGNVSFSDNDKIFAYDTTSKSPYSILKDVIGKQTRSFLYFTTNRYGDLLINYKSENDFLNQQAIEINPDNLEDLQIYNIDVQQDADNYFNTFRLESDYILDNRPYQEHFVLNNSLKGLFLEYNFGQLQEVSKDEGNYFYYLDNPTEHHSLLIVSKEEYSNGANYHVYYEEGKNELTFSTDWDKENIGLYINYYPKGKKAITLENSKEVQRINKLNNFYGDVYRYEKSNDLSSYNDLFKQAKNNLALNSYINTTLKIQTTKPFLNLGDGVILNFNNVKYDGRYICTGFNGEINGAVNEIKSTYELKNGLNADTLLNFYDSTDYKINPLSKKNIVENDKYKDERKSINFIKLKDNEQIKGNLETYNTLFIPQFLPYKPEVKPLTDKALLEHIGRIVKVFNFQTSAEIMDAIRDEE